MYENFAGGLDMPSMGMAAAAAVAVPRTSFM